MSLSTLDAFTTDHFLTALQYGGAALAAAILLGLLWRTVRKDPAPVAGLLAVGALLLALPAVREVPDSLWQGAAMLAGAGLLFPWARKAPLLPALLGVPGAWWITQRIDLPGAGWVPWLLLGVIVVGAPLLAAFDHHHTQRSLALPLLAVTAAGVFATVPDTEEALVLLGVILPLALVAWPKPLASLGAVGAYPVVGLLVWVIAWGGRGREGSIIGAAACLGLLAAEPVARWFSRRSSTLLDRFLDNPGGPVLAGLAHLLVVLGVARVAGLQSDPILAGAIAVVILVVAVVLLAFLGRVRRSRPRGYRR